MENNMNIEEKNFNIYITPKDGKYTHVIIFLHGLGDKAKSYKSFFFETTVLPTDIPIKIVLLQSPYKKLKWLKKMSKKLLKKKLN